MPLRGTARMVARRGFDAALDKSARVIEQSSFGRRMTSSKSLILIAPSFSGKMLCGAQTLRTLLRVVNQFV